MGKHSMHQPELLQLSILCMRWFT